MPHNLLLICFVRQLDKHIIKSVDIPERRDMKICSDFFSSGGSPCSKSNCGLFGQHQEAIGIKVTRNIVNIQPNIHSRKGTVQSHKKVLHNSRVLYSKLQYTNKINLSVKDKLFEFSNISICKETHFRNVVGLNEWIIQGGWEYL